MIKFKTKSGSWKIETPTIEKYYRIKEWILLSDQTDIQVKLMSILSGAPEAEIRELDTDTFIKLWNDSTLGPLSSLNDVRFEKTIKIRDIEYGFINMGDLTVGELADMDTLKAHPQMDRQLHKMMAILYRPVLESGEIEAHSVKGFNERAEIFLNEMPVSYVIAAIDFFFHITKVCLSNMMDSLVPMIEKMTQEMTTQEPNAVTQKLQEDGIDSSSFLQATTSLKQTNVLDSES